MVTSETADGLPVHYWNGRTIPHRQDRRCLPCEAGRKYRWMCYIGVWIPRTGMQSILETTARVHGQFERFVAREGALRGCCFKIWRPTGKQNGRIQVEFRRGLADVRELPPLPPVRKIMERLWEPALEIADRMAGVRPPDVPSNGSRVNNRPVGTLDVESLEAGQGGV